MEQNKMEEKTDRDILVAEAAEYFKQCSQFMKILNDLLIECMPLLKDQIKKYKEHDKKETN